MALITSDCDAMRIHEHQMALITSDCAPCSSQSTFILPPGKLGDFDVKERPPHPETLAPTCIHG